jgi:hypothetical protein
MQAGRAFVVRRGFPVPKYRQRDPRDHDGVFVSFVEA